MAPPAARQPDMAALPAAFNSSAVPAVLCLHAAPAVPLQDGATLQPGAFYLDRQPQPKHLALAGTKYSPADVDRLWAKLEAMAAPGLPTPPAAAASG